MEIQDFSISPALAPQAYVGRRLRIDGRPHQIGRLLDVGDEKFVYELLDGDGRRVDLVFKIYRDTSGLTAAKDARMGAIFAEAGVSHYPHEVCPVPGGQVALQRRIEGVTFKDPQTGATHRVHMKVEARINPDGSIEVNEPKVFLSPAEPDSAESGDTSDGAEAPESVQGHLSMAGVGELIEAYEREGLQNDPVYPALLLLDEGRLEDAHAKLNRLFDEDSTDPLVAELLVNCCMLLGRTRQALTVLLSMLAVDDAWITGWLLLARVLGYLGDVAGAMEALTRVPETPYTVPVVREIIDEMIGRL